MNGKDVNTVFTKLDSDGDGYLDDPNEAEGGYYWYQVIIDYYGNEAATNKEDFSRDAKSNRVYIYFETIPQGATVKQLAYSDRGATERVPEPMASDTEEFDPYEVSSVAEDETYWSFDLAVTAYPHESLYDKTFEKGNEDGSITETEVLSLVKYYVVGVPKNADYAVYTTARVGGENGTIVNPLTDAQMDSIKSSADALEFKPENYTYFGVKPDVKNHYAMPELILHNVVPDKYLKLDGKNFTIDMVASNGDYGEWEKTNVKTSYPEVVMYVPSTGYDLSKFNVVRATDYKGVKDAPEIHLGASKAQPVAYHAFNKLQTSEAKIKQLMVTNGVLDAWTVTYGLDMTIKDANGSTNLPVTLYYTGSNSYLNQMGGIDANFDYLPVPVATTKDYDNDTDTGISAIDDWQTRYFDASDFSVDMTVKYTRNDDIDNPDNNPSVDAAPSTFTEIINKTSNGENNVTDLDKLVAYVNAALASNGYTVHNLGAWSSQTSDGEVIYYLDAFKAINLNNSDNTLAKTVGYYSSNGYEPTVTYYKETPDAGYQPFEAVPGGEVIIPATEEEYSAPFDEFYGIGSNNFAEYAAEKGVLPIKIGFVGEGSSEIANITDKDELLKAIKALDIAPIYTLVTAEYPFLVKPTFTQGEGAASEYDGYDLVTLAYPFVVGASDSDITTETINIAVDGASDFRIYPNPAVDVVNVAASAELGTIEIYSIDGRLVKVIEVDDTRAAIEVGDLAKGNYIVRAAGATQRMIKM